MAWDLMNEWTFSGTGGMPLKEFLQANKINEEIRRTGRLTADTVRTALQTQSREISLAFSNALATDPIARTIAGPLSLDYLASGFDTARIEDGLEALRADFNWGIGEIIWRLEMQGKQLQSMIEILMAPLETAAKELRRRAEFAYQNGWIEEAEKDFLKSAELNYQDFTVFLSLGHIYFYQKQKPQTALPCFEKAAKYAIPRSSQHAAEAYLMASLTSRLLGNSPRATQAAEQAIKFNPNLSEAHYQLAKLLALTGIYKEESIRHLKTAIDRDVKYCEKARQDPDFDKVRNLVNELLEKLRLEARRDALRLFSQQQKIFIQLQQEFPRIPLEDKPEGIGVQIDSIKGFIKEVEELLAENSYFGYLKIITLMSEVEETTIYFP